MDKVLKIGIVGCGAIGKDDGHDGAHAAALFPDDGGDAHALAGRRKGIRRAERIVGRQDEPVVAVEAVFIRKVIVEVGIDIQVFGRREWRRNGWFSCGAIFPLVV